MLNGTNNSFKRILYYNPIIEEGVKLNNNYRPILKLRKTKSEWMWDVIGGALFIGTIAFIVFSWNSIPDKVPGHYNALGEVDRWGSKYELLVLPIVGFILWGLMNTLEKFPHVHNYPERLNEMNVEAFYLNSRKLLNSMKNVCLLTFAYLMFQTIRVALGDIESLGLWFLPVMLIVFAGIIIRGLIKSSRIK